jgi:hypothetical protein
MIFKKIKKNMACTAKLSEQWIVLLCYCISNVLAVTRRNKCLKEIKFSTEARNTNNSFLAADTGTECALFNDKSTINAFTSPSPATITCNGVSVALNGASPSWNFVLSGLGSGGQSCAKVTVDKSGSCGSATCIISKGYNDGGSVTGSCLQGRDRKTI